MNPMMVQQRPAPATRENRATRPGGVAGLREVVAATREHLPLLAILGLYLLARLAWTGGRWPIDWSSVQVLVPSFVVLAGLGIVVVAVGHAFRVTSARPGTFAAFRLETWIGFRREYLSVGRVTSVLIAVGFLSVFLPLFIDWKADIGTSPPFRWDERFMRWDEAIHFGRHPWEWLHPLLGHPALTRVIDVLYHWVWTISIMPLLLLMAWSSNRVLAARFLVSYALLWIVVGTIFAYIFSAAGPVYYANVVDAVTDPYSELISYLKSVHAEHGLASVVGSSLLWSNFVTQDWPRVGISAMPSMHVAIATLVVVLGFRVHRLWGLLAVLYLCIVFVGSVHLAWHYAIDGYVSMLLVGPLWWLGGLWSRRWIVGADQGALHCPPAEQPGPGPITPHSPDSRPR
jgi:hypothetical protein